MEVTYHLSKKVPGQNKLTATAIDHIVQEGSENEN